jgi:GntR family transcriptional regulator
MTKLNRDEAVPLYAQLTDLLLGEIISSKLKPGNKIPSINEIQKKWGVSSVTARRALEELIRLGVVHTVPGKGAFVAEPRVDYYLYKLAGFSDDMKRRNMEPSSKVLKAVLISASNKIAQALEIPIGARVYELNRLRFADGIAMSLQDTYIPYDLCPDLLEYDFKHESLFHIVTSRYNLNIIESKHRIRARLATSKELELLNLSSPSAVLEVEVQSITSSGRVLESGVIIYPGDRYDIYSLYSVAQTPQIRGSNQ